MAGVTDAALGTGARIGRYFNVVSFVPSLLFVLYLGALLRAGAWSGRLHPSDALITLSVDDAGAITAVTVLSLALGFALHPFQFATTQLLEGYWGPHRVARRFATARTLRHQSRALDLEITAAEASNSIKDDLMKGLRPAERARLAQLPAEEQQRRLKIRQGTRPGLKVTHLIVREEAARRARGAYPREVDRVRPTRLGNALRRFEDAAGSSYGLDVISVAPHLSLVAESVHVAWQADVRRQLDFCIRLCTLGLLATPLTAALLYDDGKWVFLTLAPFAVAYLAYRGAISSAQGYGVAVTTVLDLNRFRLYEALRLQSPVDAARERATNKLLLNQLRGNATVGLTYSLAPNSPGDPARATAAAPPTPTDDTATGAAPDLA